MVSPERSRCERTAPSPVRSVSSQLMRAPGLVPVLLDEAVTDPDDAPARWATSGSWVIRTMVRPDWWSSSNKSSTSAVAVESRFPVGSSARISAGSVTRARAMATRCCCPPDSSPGRC